MNTPLSALPEIAPHDLMRDAGIVVEQSVGAPAVSASAAISPWRCADCGHGENLCAWWLGVTEGRIAADGSMGDGLSGFEPCDLQMSSIQCEIHLDSVIEHLIDGEWCRAAVCPDCWEDGRSRTVFGLCRRCGGSHQIEMPVTQTTTGVA